MTIQRILLIIAVLITRLANGQTDTSLTTDHFNFGFENSNPGDKLPTVWRIPAVGGYEVLLDSTEKRSGKYALSIRSTGSEPATYYTVSQVIPAMYKGKTIELGVSMKYQDVSEHVGFVLRIDDVVYNVLEFENMYKRGLSGSGDWQRHYIKFNLPDEAYSFFITPLLVGTGQLWVDDVTITIDGKDFADAPLKPNYDPDAPRYGANIKAGNYVKINGAEIYYETYGEGEPLLLLHGNSQSIKVFGKHIPELARHFKIIAVDTRAQGRSRDDGNGPLSYDLFADDMKQLLDSIGIKKTNIVGWSDGGNTGLLMALKYPSYVDKLVTCGAVLFASDEAVPSEVLKAVKKAVKRLRKRDDRHANTTRRLYQMLLDEPKMTYEQVEAIQSPVLVMAGENDTVLQSHTEAIAEHIPHSTLHIMEGTTHYAPVEEPEMFCDLVVDFLTGQVDSR